MVVVGHNYARTELQMDNVEALGVHFYFTELVLKGKRIVLELQQSFLKEAGRGGAHVPTRWRFFLLSWFWALKGALACPLE